MSNTMPMSPKASIGSKEYPKELITLYKGMISDWVNEWCYLVHKVDQEVHDGVAEQEHCVNVAEVHLPWQEQQTSET